MTSVTERIIRQAQHRGFRIRTTTVGGRTIHVVDQHGQDGCFGAIYVGRRSGRITGAILHQGNQDAAGTRVRGALATGRAIRATPTRPAGFPVWSVRTRDEQGREGWAITAPTGTLLVTPAGDVHWAERDEVLLHGDDLERCQRWAEEYAETHSHPAAET
jgi:hypothetical protein